MRRSNPVPARLRALKRTTDLFVSAIAGVVLSPVIVGVWIAVRIFHGAPAIFVQTRPGLREEPFKMYKFRTMRVVVDAAGCDLPDGERLTRLGRVLRATSLDELPSLMNVLRGEMSLVGPRPLLERYLPVYTDAERVRFDVRPGITGLAQVSGRNLVGWDRRLALDVEYVERLSFWLDAKIIARTVGGVLSVRGVATDTDLIEEFLDVERMSQTGESRGAD